MKQVKRLLPLVGGLALITVLLWQVHPREVWRLLSQADPRWLLVGCGWYVLTNVLRACRFGVLLSLPGRGGPLRILPEMFALSLLNNVLPGRAGELSFPYFLYRRHNVGVGDSATALVVARLFDYLAVALLFVGFTLLEIQELDVAAARILEGVGFVLLLSVGLLAAAPWVAEIVFRFALWAIGRTRFAGGRAEHLAAGLRQQVSAAFARIRSPRTYGLTLLWSLPIWLCTFAWFSSFLSAFGLPMPYPLVVVGATFASLAKAIPFITIGGFGAHEAGWTLGFTLVGMERTAAIASGFAVNILTLLTSALFGGAALLWMNGLSRLPRLAEREL